MIFDKPASGPATTLKQVAITTDYEAMGPEKRKQNRVERATFIVIGAVLGTAMIVSALASEAAQNGGDAVPINRTAAALAPFEDLYPPSRTSAATTTQVLRPALSQP